MLTFSNLFFFAMKRKDKTRVLFHAFPFHNFQLINLCFDEKTSQERTLYNAYTNVFICATKRFAMLVL